MLREVKELRELSAGGGHAREVSIEDAVVEFVEPRVPDGISLRNFGIQTVSISTSPSYMHSFFFLLLRDSVHTPTLPGC